MVDEGQLVAGAASMAAEQARAGGAIAVVLAVPVGIETFVEAAAEPFDR